MTRSRRKRLLAAPIAAALCIALPSESFAIMSCGNRWQPTHNGIGQAWGLTNFTLPGGANNPFPSTSPFGGAAAGAAQILTGLTGGPSFAPSDYSFDCSTVLVPAFSTSNKAWGPNGPYTTTTNFPATHACRINKAPTVDMAFVAALQAQGYNTEISYPYSNPGTGMAVVTWALDSNGFNQPCPAGWPAYDELNGNTIANGCGVSNIGLAYVTGAGWTNQFTPLTTMGGQVAALPDAADAVIVGIFEPHPSVAGDMCPLQYSLAAPIVLIGSFQPPTPPAPPPLPALPPSVAGIPADPLNTAATGVNTNNGGTAANTAGGQNQVPFDYVAFCNRPARDGSTRSPQFVSNCLARSPAQ